MSRKTAICPLAEILVGEIKGASLPDGERIALFNVDGAIYATDDLCTHGQSSLSEEGTLNGKTVECGWHFGAFDVTTGAACAMPCITPLCTYPVSIVEGIVHVEK